jgi:hydrogenase maturation protease
LKTLILGLGNPILSDDSVGFHVVQALVGRFELKPEDFVIPRHTGSPHDVSLIATLELGKRLGLEMPKEIVIFAIEVQDVINFGEKCTPEVEQVIPKVVAMVASELKGGEKPRTEE